MWKNGTELVHLEWKDSAEEIVAAVSPKTFFDKSVRITSADMSADAIQATLETGLKNVQAIMKMCGVQPPPELEAQWAATDSDKKKKA